MGENEHCTTLGLYGRSSVQQSRGDSRTVLCHLDMGVAKKTHLLDSRGPSGLEFDLFALLWKN